MKTPWVVSDALLSPQHQILAASAENLCSGLPELTLDEMVCETLPVREVYVVLEFCLGSAQLGVWSLRWFALLSAWTWSRGCSRCTLLLRDMSGWCCSGAR